MFHSPDPAFAKPSPPALDWPYLLPMGVFMAFIFVGGLADRLYPWAYVGRTLIVGGLLIWVWPRVKRDVAWTHLPLGVLVGVVGTVQWIGTESLLIHLVGRHGFSLSLVQLVSDADKHFDYPNAFASPVALWSFLAIRLFGPVLVVPAMEELFWRDWLWRTVAASESTGRIDDVPVGRYSARAFWLVPLAFALVHVQFLTAVVWGLMIAWLLVRTKSLGACIVAHATDKPPAWAMGAGDVEADPDRARAVRRAALVLLVTRLLLVTRAILANRRVSRIR